MENANLLDGETVEELISETFYIKRGEIRNKLDIELNKEYIKLQISEENLFDHLYEKKLDLEGVKALHNTFSKFNSCQELLNYIKGQIKDNFLEIKKISNNRISLKFKQEKIEINLFKIKASTELIMRNLCEEILHLKSNCKILEMNNQHAIEEKNAINKKLESLIKGNEDTINKIKNLEEENKKILEDNKKILKENKKIKDEKKK